MDLGDTDLGDTDLGDIDLCDLDRFADGFPHEVFAELRRRAPVWWHPPTPLTPGGAGFWVVSTHAGTRAVLADPVTFSSQTGPGRDGAGGTTLVDMAPGFVTGVMLNMTDPPDHDRMRALVARAFGPRATQRLEPWLRERAAELVDAAVERGEVDVLVEVAAELPLRAIAELLGVPAEDRHQLFAWTTTILDHADRQLTETTDELAHAGIGLQAYGSELFAAKRARPGDDLVSEVAAADPPLSTIEEQAFFSLLFTAGSETTRNSIAGGLLALGERPDEWRRLRDDRSLVPTAVEEILRWTSATAYNRRTATVDTELGGHRVRAGEKVTHWYPSANRDEAVFDDPFRFDVGRSPNPHLAFGHGIHHCLGATLARREVAIMLEAVLDRVAELHPSGPVEWGRSNKHTAIRHLPMRLVPA